MAIGRPTSDMYTPYRSLLRDALELAYEWHGSGDIFGALPPLDPNVHHRGRRLDR
jgi:hypothetical protein